MIKLKYLFLEELSRSTAPLSDFSSTIKVPSSAPLSVPSSSIISTSTTTATHSSSSATSTISTTTTSKITTIIDNEVLEKIFDCNFDNQNGNTQICDGISVQSVPNLNGPTVGSVANDTIPTNNPLWYITDVTSISNETILKCKIYIFEFILQLKKSLIQQRHAKYRFN